MTFDDLSSEASALLDLCRSASVRLATAESCTGGLIIASLTAIAGSSDVVERGFVTYTNEAKSELLGVPASLIDTKGAVSAPVAKAMAEGALEHSRADIAISVTGIAGPGGGSTLKPVGLVHFGLARRGGELIHREERFGPLSRQDIRLKSVGLAFELIRSHLG